MRELSLVTISDELKFAITRAWTPHYCWQVARVECSTPSIEAATSRSSFIALMVKWYVNRKTLEWMNEIVVWMMMIWTKNREEGFNECEKEMRAFEFNSFFCCCVLSWICWMQCSMKPDSTQSRNCCCFCCIFHLILLSIAGNRIKELQMANLLVLLCYFVRISSTMSILLYKLFRLLPPLIIHDRQVAFQRAIKVKAKTLTTTEKKKPRGLLIRLFLLFSKQLVSWECWAHTRKHDPARSSRATATRFRWIFIAYTHILCDDTAGLLRPDRERLIHTSWRHLHSSGWVVAGAEFRRNIRWRLYWIFYGSMTGRERDISAKQTTNNNEHYIIITSWKAQHNKV